MSSRSPAPVLGCAVLLVVAGLAVLIVIPDHVIPNLVKVSGRARWHECRLALKDIYAAAKAHQARVGVLTDDPTTLGFSAPKRARYSFIFGPAPSAAVWAKGEDPGVARAEVGRQVSVGVTGACPACELTVACIAHFNPTGMPDLWSVSTAPRATGAGEVVPAGTPFRHLDDVNEEVSPRLFAVRDAGAPSPP